jgi:predicted peroxiredoxin
MAVPFDTHAVITKLQQSGFAAEQAEALSDALKMAHESGVEALATKHDVQALELRLDNKIEGLRGTMEARFAELQGKISLLNWRFGALLAAMIPIFVRVVFKV